MGRFNFGNIVVVDEGSIGVVVKCWGDDSYEVYVRHYNSVETYKTKDIEHYTFDKQAHEDFTL